MEEQIEKAIKKEARRRIMRNIRNSRIRKKRRDKFEQRYGERLSNQPDNNISHRSLHRHFNPVYCLRNRKFLAEGIWNNLVAGTYEVTPAIRLSFPKSDGSKRYIDVFAIPDAAIAKVFFSKLRKRNERLYSDGSFAYHREKTTLDAIVKIRKNLEGGKVYVSNYDFKKYFDNISHEYVFDILENKNLFQTTFLERNLLRSVLKHRYQHKESYNVLHPEVRNLGIPQGNTLSSFLANIAAHELDEDLDRNNGIFVRYADDIICINYSYDAAINCAHIFHRFEQKSGIEINRDKSMGICLYADFAPKIAGTDEINFLSYKISNKGTPVSDKKVKNIKSRCSKIVYDNLLQVPKQTGFLSDKRFDPDAFDWDLVNCINQLRKYIYGRNSEAAIRGYLMERRNIKKIDGIVGYYCLVTDPDVFRVLDGWLVDIIRRAYRKRAKMMREMGCSLSVLGKQQLLRGDWYQHRFRIDPRIPSFYYGWRAASKSWARNGVGAIDPNQLVYSYEEE